jgi:hypothetical protein
MKDADFILNWTEDLKAEIKSLAFAHDDIRKNYFELTYDVAYCYYRGFILLDFSDFINNGYIVFKKEIYENKIHIDRVAETTKNPILKKSHFNSLNRNFLIDAWSTFELCVTTIAEAITTEDEKNKLLMHQYNDIKTLIKKIELTEFVDLNIQKLIKKDHLTHVPITRKTDLLFNKAYDYGRNKQCDKEFLKFLGKFRNTLHTNFIYYGKDYEYKFGDAHFIFQDGKIVKWADPFFPSPKLYFYLIGNLKEIWKELINSIKHETLIKYPDNEQE